MGDPSIILSTILPSITNSPLLTLQTTTLSSLDLIRQQQEKIRRQFREQELLYQNLINSQILEDKLLYNNNDDDYDTLYNNGLRFREYAATKRPRFTPPMTSTLSTPSTTTELSFHKRFLNHIINNVGQVAAGVGQAANTAVSGVGHAAEAASQGVGQAAGAAAGGIGQAASSAANGIGQVTNNVVSSVGGLLSPVNGIFRLIDNFKNSFQRFFDQDYISKIITMTTLILISVLVVFFFCFCCCCTPCGPWLCGRMTQTCASCWKLKKKKKVTSSHTSIEKQPPPAGVFDINNNFSIKNQNEKKNNSKTSLDKKSSKAKLSNQIEISTVSSKLTSSKRMAPTAPPAPLTYSTANLKSIDKKKSSKK
jgi:hypothetical protein